MIRIVTMNGEVKFLGDVGPRGPKGEQGEQGPIGPIGPQGPAGGDYDDTELRNLIANKVDKEVGKVLSTNDYTTEEKNKLTNLPINPITEEEDPTVPAHVKNITEEDIKKWNEGGGTSGNVEWDDILNKPTQFTPNSHTHTSEEVTGLSTIATTGDYNDLKNKPTVPTKTSELTNDSNFVNETYVKNEIANAQLGGDSGEIDLSGYATKDDLNNKVDKVTGKSLIADTEIERLASVTNYDDTEIKNSLNNKADKNELHSHTNKGALDTITQAKVQNWDNKSDFSGNYNDLTNKPTIPTKTSQLNNDSEFLTEHQDISGLATKDELNNKQDKLVAGDNITITGNTISATGSGESNILTFENITVATTSFVEDSTYEEFSYKAEIPCAGVTVDFFSDVTFDVAEAISGNYAPISLTGAGTVTIYAVEQPESTITIPSIICSKGA